jgi:glycerophosphoryl diester phosphodiesterase
MVHPFTFRNENQFLPAENRSSGDPNAYGDAFAEYQQFYDLGVDGVFSDAVDTAVAALELPACSPDQHHRVVAWRIRPVTDRH